jgi:hypothetical protein
LLEAIKENETALNPVTSKLFEKRVNMNQRMMTATSRTSALAKKPLPKTI